MPLYLPLIPLLIWFGPVPMAVLLAQELTRDVLQDWQNAFLDNCVFCAGAIVTTAVILLLARAHFARRLTGFGLTTRTMAADFFAAFVNLLTVWPLIMAAIILTQYIGEQIWGRDYQMQPHQELELITEYPQLPLRIAIAVVAAIVAPVLEELLFRGLVQTTIRSVLDLRFSNFDCRFEIGPVLSRVEGNRQPAAGNRQSTRAWLAIGVSSGLFAMMHANPGHWPALFVLSVCLGYAYERSGSLFRPIFIHSLFNGVSVAATLSQS
jgi:membrane protease YdiL (CAAX protease family)